MATMPVDGVAAAIETVARDDVRVRARGVDRERSFPAEGIAALAAAGAMGLMVPEACGGIGGSLSALAEACEAVGGACASTGMVFLMHSVAAATIAAGGGPRAEEVLAEMATGSLGTLAFSERGTGAHFYAPELRAERADDGARRITGRKRFVTSGGQARYYLVLVAGAEAGTADAYLIEREREGAASPGTRPTGRPRPPPASPIGTSAATSASGSPTSAGGSTPTPTSASRWWLRSSAARRGSRRSRA